jgi:hypothetical protein
VLGQRVILLGIPLTARALPLLPFCSTPPLEDGQPEQQQSRNQAEERRGVSRRPRRNLALWPDAPAASTAASSALNAATPAGLNAPLHPWVRGGLIQGSVQNTIAFQLSSRPGSEAAVMRANASFPSLPLRLPVEGVDSRDILGFSPRPPSCLSLAGQPRRRLQLQSESAGCLLGHKPP